VPGAALAQELREELGIDIAPPPGLPMQDVHADTFDMHIWLIEAWMGSPANVAPEEHDAIAWFTEDVVGRLCLAHDSYLAMFTKAFAEHRSRRRAARRPIRRHRAAGRHTDDPGGGSLRVQNPCPGAAG
jgi:hypothetical protein